MNNKPLTDEQRQLAEESRKLPRWFARKFVHSRRMFNDAESVGDECLIDCVRQFDPTSGFKFSSYFTRSMFRDWEREERFIGWYFLKLDPYKIKERYRRSGRIATGKSKSIGNVRIFAWSQIGIPDIEDRRDIIQDLAVEPDEIPEIGDIYAGFWDAVNKRMHSKRQMRFVWMHVVEGRTLKEIGDEVGITRERVRQIVENGLSKLREKQDEFVKYLP